MFRTSDISLIFWKIVTVLTFFRMESLLLELHILRFKIIVKLYVLCKWYSKIVLRLWVKWKIQFMAWYYQGLNVKPNMLRSS